MKIAAACWVAIGLLLALSSQVAVERLWMAALVPVVIWGIAGIIIVAIALLRLRRPEARRSTAAVLAAVLGTAIVFDPVARGGGIATRWLRFRWHRAAYDRVVATVLAATPTTGRGAMEGVDYVVDAGPPPRIAFPWPGGIVDNWCGAIYDPTAAVLKSNAFDGNWTTWREQVPAEVIALFGGDLVACGELERPYFLCCFT